MRKPDITPVELVYADPINHPHLPHPHLPHLHGDEEPAAVEVEPAPQKA